MIESGSRSLPGPVDNFGLPSNAALRFELPAPELRDFLMSYVVLDAEHPAGEGTVDWLLPSWAQIWIILSDRPVAVRIGNRRYDPMPQAALYGVTSHAMPVTSHGGVTVGIYLSPLAWARLFRVSAESLRDRLTPLAEAMSPALVAELVDRLGTCDPSIEVPAILDDIFARALATPNRDEPQIAAIMAAIGDGHSSDIGSVARATGVSPPAMRRLANRYFGFPPKVLQLRARFLKSLAPMLARGRLDPSLVSLDYHDMSHFDRDARRFLGMTAARFLAQPMPYLRAALDARRLVTDQGRRERRP